MQPESLRAYPFAQRLGRDAYAPHAKLRLCPRRFFFMYICYLDESGTPELSGSTDHFTLLGLAVPAETWKARDADVDRIKVRYGLADAEIHTAWMLRDYPEQRVVPNFDSLDENQKRRAVLGVRALNLGRARSLKQQKALQKNYRKTEEYVHLTRAERIACVNDLADMVGSWRDARAFADCQTKAHMVGADCFDIAFEQVVSRFDIFLRNAGGRSGLLVQDNNPTMAQRLTDAMRKYHRNGTLWTQIHQIIETPLFVDSRLTAMVQLADLCAYATRRYFDNGERALFDRISPIFDRNAGRLVGLRHYTARYQCRCDICMQHGRYGVVAPVV